jgi:hypothetical protein
MTSTSMSHTLESRAGDMEGASSGFSFLCHDSERMYTYRLDALQKRRPLMSDDLATLETQRSKLREDFLRLGDLRPGSITAVTRRCGKPSCHCAKHNDPGHDRQFRLTRRVSGKTVTETFPDPTALRKAQQEVAEFHRFQKLSQDLVALNYVFQNRLKISGAWWKMENLRKMIALRVLRANGGWEDYWSNLHQQAA